MLPKELRNLFIGLGDTTKYNILHLNLQTKSFYTGLTKILQIGLSFIVQFMITPFLLGSLGKELFGVYVIINKLQGYVSVVDLRPSAILRFKLSASQTENNIISKREYIGSSLIVSAILLPFIILVGYFLSLGFGYYFKIDEQYILVGKTAVILLSIFIGIKGFLGVPEAIIRGNNAEYKLFFVEPLRLIAYSALVYVFINKGFGILGIIAAIVLAGFFDFILKLILQRKLYPLLKPLLPGKIKISEFMGKGSWYLLSSLGSQLVNNSDIVIIGITIGTKAVAMYSLSKMMIFRVSESFASVLGAITASIGHLISEENTQKLIEIRYKLLRYNILLGGLIITYFVWFNAIFVCLWVDSSNYIGESANIFLCLVGVFTLLCLSNEILINSFQLFRQKSVISLMTAAVFLLTAYLLSKQWGLLGICCSLLVAKTLHWCGYEILLQQNIRIRGCDVIMTNYKTIVLILLMLCIRIFIFEPKIESWYMFIASSTLYLVLYTLIIYTFIMTQKEKKLLIHFFKSKLNV